MLKNLRKYLGTCLVLYTLLATYFLAKKAWNDDVTTKSSDRVKFLNVLFREERRHIRSIDDVVSNYRGVVQFNVQNHRSQLLRDGRKAARQNGRKVQSSYATDVYADDAGPQNNASIRKSEDSNNPGADDSGIRGGDLEQADSRPKFAVVVEDWVKDSNAKGVSRPNPKFNNVVIEENTIVDEDGKPQSDLKKSSNLTKSGNTKNTAKHQQRVTIPPHAQQKVENVSVTQYCDTIYEEGKLCHREKVALRHKLHMNISTSPPEFSKFQELHIFSAFLDPRHKQSAVRIMTLGPQGRGRTRSLYWCVFNFSGKSSGMQTVGTWEKGAALPGKPVATRLVYHAASDGHNKDFQFYVMSCPMPVEAPVVTSTTFTIVVVSGTMESAMLDIVQQKIAITVINNVRNANRQNNNTVNNNNNNTNNNINSKNSIVPLGNNHNQPSTVLRQLLQVKEADTLNKVNYDDEDDDERKIDTIVNKLHKEDNLRKHVEQLSNVVGPVKTNSVSRNNNNIISNNNNNNNHANQVNNSNAMKGDVKKERGDKVPDYNDDDDDDGDASEKGEDVEMPSIHVSATPPPTVSRDSIISCVAPLQHVVSVIPMVEFIEQTLLLGSQHIVFYTFQLNREAQAVLDMYVAQGLVTVINWNFPVPEQTWAKGRDLALNDCLYRSMFLYEYALFHDMDEFYVPRITPDLPSLLKYLRINAFLNTTRVSDLVFSSAYFAPPAKAQLKELSSLAGYSKDITKLVTLKSIHRTYFNTQHHALRMLKLTACFRVGAGERKRTSFNVSPRFAGVNHYSYCLGKNETNIATNNGSSSVVKQNGVGSKLNAGAKNKSISSPGKTAVKSSSSSVVCSHTKVDAVMWRYKDKLIQETKNSIRLLNRRPK